MIRGLYIATTGLLTQRRRMDVLSNNIANVETTGYKRDYSMSKSFEDVLISQLNRDGSGAQDSSTPIGNITWGVYMDQITTDFSQSPLEVTNRTADLALQGDGFFTIETPNGVRYTRAGNFQVDGQGYLCTSEGNYVMSTTGRIRVGGQDFTVDPNGVVTSAAGRWQLRLASFPQTAVLLKDGSNLFTTTAAPTASAATVRHGALESSNVDVAQEMVDMIAVSRSYEANQKVITTLNDSLSKTVNDVGRV